MKIERMVDGQAFLLLGTCSDPFPLHVPLFPPPFHHLQDFNTMYELYDPCTVMFFFRNKHIMIDLGTGE